MVGSVRGDPSHDLVRLLGRGGEGVLRGEKVVDVDDDGGGDGREVAAHRVVHVVVAYDEAATVEVDVDRGRGVRVLGWVVDGGLGVTLGGGDGEGPGTAGDLREGHRGRHRGVRSGLHDARQRAGDEAGEQGHEVPSIGEEDEEDAESEPSRARIEARQVLSDRRSVTRFQRKGPPV